MGGVEEGGVRGCGQLFQYSPMDFLYVGWIVRAKKAENSLE